MELQVFNENPVAERHDSPIIGGVAGEVRYRVYGLSQAEAIKRNCTKYI